MKRLPPVLFVFCLLIRPASAQTQETPGAAYPGALDRIQALEDRVNKLEGAPAKTSLSAFNPAIGMALDTALRSADGKAGFDFRAAELNVEAPIDPFLKGWAVITGSNNNAKPVNVEEAALETTSLPCNLTVRGGRLFADFGRLAHFHDHELPVIARPRSLDAYIGGETRADGLEASYLFPMDAYLNATLGMLDKLGAGNDRQDPAGSRSLSEFTYTGRLSAYADLGLNHSLDLGVSEAWTPKRSVSDTAGLGINTVKDTWRTLTGLDLTYRYAPVQGGLYRGMVWGTEVLQNDERRFNPATMLPTARVRAYSGYSYIWVKTGLRWRPGIMADMTEDLDQAGKLLKTYTAFATFDLTEFQRLRVAYARTTNNVPGMPRSDAVAFQWTGVLGHHVHGFRDR